MEPPSFLKELSWWQITPYMSSRGLGTFASLVRGPWTPKPNLKPLEARKLAQDSAMAWMSKAAEQGRAEA